MGEKIHPTFFAGMGTGKIFPRGDGDGGSIPDGEFPIAIYGAGHVHLEPNFLLELLGGVRLQCHVLWLLQAAGGCSDLEDPDATPYKVFLLACPPWQVLDG